MRAGSCCPSVAYCYRSVSFVPLFCGYLHIHKILFYIFALFINYKITSQSSRHRIFPCISMGQAVTLFYAEEHDLQETVDISAKIALR